MSRRRTSRPVESVPAEPALPAFVLLPVPQIAGATPLAMQQMLYQLALQQAREQAASQRPGLYDRDWLGSRN